MGNRKSLMSRLPGGKVTDGSALSHSSRKNPTNAQIYRDVNHALGMIFRAAFSFIGIDIDKYARAKPRHRGHKSKKKFGLF